MCGAVTKRLHLAPALQAAAAQAELAAAVSERDAVAAARDAAMQQVADANNLIAVLQQEIAEAKAQGTPVGEGESVLPSGQGR